MRRVSPQGGLLRIALPPLRGEGLCHAAWRTADGVWHRETVEPGPALAVLADRAAAKRMEVCPHPADLAMTEVEMPALPAKRLREAVPR